MLHLAVHSDVILWLNLLHSSVKWLHIGVAFCCIWQLTLLYLAEVMVPLISKVTTTPMVSPNTNNIHCCIWLYLVSVLISTGFHFGRVCIVLTSYCVICWMMESPTKRTSGSFSLASATLCSCYHKKNNKSFINGWLRYGWNFFQFQSKNGPVWWSKYVRLSTASYQLAMA